jgi:hypothetical protein
VVTHYGDAQIAGSEPLGSRQQSIVADDDNKGYDPEVADVPAPRRRALSITSDELGARCPWHILTLGS